jgi:hypothetical protein
LLAAAKLGLLPSRRTARNSIRWWEGNGSDKPGNAKLTEDFVRMFILLLTAAGAIPSYMNVIGFGPPILRRTRQTCP